MQNDQVFGNYTVKMEGLKGAESALKFFRANLGGSNVTLSQVKHFSENGTPAPLSGGGHQTSHEPITLERYFDGDMSLADWFKEVTEKGAVTGETKQDPTITCLSNDQPLFLIKLVGAVPTSHRISDVSAQDPGLITETVTITYDEREITAG